MGPPPVLTAVQADAAQCTELFTQAYLDDFFGKEFGDATDNRATVVSVPVGGANDGVALTYQLVLEDEQWRVNDIAQIG